MKFNLKSYALCMCLSFICNGIYYLYVVEKDIFRQGVIIVNGECNRRTAESCTNLI